MQALIMTDNGANYHSTGFLSGMHAVCKSAGMSLQEVWNCAPSHGKHQVDGIFALSKRTVGRGVTKLGLDAAGAVHFAHIDDMYTCVLTGSTHLHQCSSFSKYIGQVSRKFCLF